MYLLFRAARYIGCKPWELDEMPICWRNYALAYDSAEQSAQAEAEKEQARLMQRQMQSRR